MYVNVQLVQDFFIPQLQFISSTFIQTPLSQNLISNSSPPEVFLGKDATDLQGTQVPIAIGL